MPLSILELLNLGRFPDLERVRQGHVAIHQPQNGPLSYRIKINDPLPSQSIEHIVGFGLGADPDLIRQLYQLCNGLWVADFAVYGLLSGPSGLSQPWDINVPNLYGRPEGLSESFLIVGLNDEKSADAQTLRLSHCITADGRIVVMELVKPTIFLREYRSIEDWLQTETERALTAPLPDHAA
jgi:hypothetical protein